MGLILVYSDIAKNDLKEIYNYVKRGSLKYAVLEIQLIRARVQKLKHAPLAGKKFERSENELAREIAFKNYRIIYDYESESRIIILTIHHHSRLISNNPAFKDEL